MNFEVFISVLLDKLKDKSDIHGKISWSNVYAVICSSTHLTPSEVRAFLRVLEKKAGLVSLSSHYVKVNEEQVGVNRKLNLGPVMAEESPEIPNQLSAQTACSSHCTNKKQEVRR